MRKLTKSKIKEKLRDIGYTDEQLDAASRWDMIAMLKDVSQSNIVPQTIEAKAALGDAK